MIKLNSESACHTAVEITKLAIETQQITQDRDPKQYARNVLDFYEVVSDGLTVSNAD